MERFSADHIRQQPEFRFLMYKEKSQVIQTCVEDGEIKIRLGQHPTPKRNDVNTSRPTSGHNSTKSGASSTAISNGAVRGSTVARAHSSAAADRPSAAETSETRQRKLGMVNGQLCDHTHEDRNLQDHRSVATSTAATKNRFGEIEEQSWENEEYKLAANDSKDDTDVNKQKNRSGCKIKGNPEISGEVLNKAASSLRQGREIAEKNLRAKSNEASHFGASAEPRDNRKITNGDSDLCTKQTAELCLAIGQTSVNEDRNAIKDCNTGISLTPEEHTAGQSTNKRSSSHLKKQGGITELSANTESTHVTEWEHDKHFTDPAIQATKKDITEGKTCGITEQGRPSHTIKEDKKTETKIKDHSMYDSGILQAGGQIDDRIQDGEHSVSGQVKVEDGTRNEMSSYLAGHPFMKRIQASDGFANIVEDTNEVNGVNSSLCEYKHTDDVVPDVDKVLKKENVQTKVSSTKKNEKTKPKVGKAPSMSRPAVNQQTSKENSAVRSKSTQGKCQKPTKKSEMMNSSRKKSSDVAKLEHGTKNEFVTQQAKTADHQPQSSTWHLDSTSKAPSTQNSLCNHSANLRTASKNQQERRKPKCFSGDKRERAHSPISQMSLDTYDKENCSDLIVSQQNATQPYETLITDAIAGANDRMMDHVSCQIDAKYSAASDHVSLDPIQGVRINQSGEDRYSMAGSAVTHAEDEDLHSESLLEYPRPVTRVDVRETPRNNDKTNKPDRRRPDPAENHQGKTSKSSKSGNVIATSTREPLHRSNRTVSDGTAAHRANDHSETNSKGSYHVKTKIIATDPADHHPERSLRMNGQGVQSVFTNRTQNSPQETDNTPSGMTADPSQEYGVDSFMDQGKENALLTCFTIPAIVVDKASTIGDASNYSDDIDAVLIDAEEYLAFVQNGQAINQDSSLAQSHKQKNQYWHQLADRHQHAEWMLDVTPNPELPGEQMPHSKSSQHVLKPRLENTHKYNSSAALELSGLRTTLTPSPYNIEFHPSTSHGRRSPHTDLSLQSGTARASPHMSRHSPRPSTSDCTFPGRTSSSVSKHPMSKPNGTFLAPQSPEGSKPGSHKSAMSSRRSSLNSVGMVHWDQAVTDPSALGRQISWEENIPDTPARPLPRRRHSSALGIRHENLLDMSAQLVVTQLSSASEPSMGRSLALESSPERRRHSVACTALDDPTGERKLSTASALSTGHSQRSSVVNQEELDKAELDRQASQYDPKVEKSRRYNHQTENDAFNKACQWLSPVRRGLRTLQVQYSQTNTTHNDSLIFAHLLRAAHVKNAAVEDAVYNTERRLYTRRHTDVPHATTFFDTPPGDHPANTRGGKGKKNETARRSSSASTGSKGYRTVAKKKKERRERIKKKNEELELGYTPRAQSLRVLGPEDIEAILTQCRHLRVAPQLQQHLYNTDITLPEEPLESTATSLA